MFGFGKKTKTVEEMLTALNTKGVHLTPGKSVQDLTSEWSREDIEEGGWEAMLVAMGGELFDEKSNSEGFISRDIWHFDAECIEDHGAYVRIARRVIDMSGGELSLEPISDYVDVEEGIAWIEWTVAGRSVRHELQVNDDWVDQKIFELLEDQLRTQGSTRRLASVSLGQDCLLFCSSPKTQDQLAKLTQLKIGSVV